MCSFAVWLLSCIVIYMRFIQISSNTFSSNIVFKKFETYWDIEKNSAVSTHILSIRIYTAITLPHYFCIHQFSLLLAFQSVLLAQVPSSQATSICLSLLQHILDFWKVLGKSGCISERQSENYWNTVFEFRILCSNIS